MPHGVCEAAWFGTGVPRHRVTNCDLFAAHPANLGAHARTPPCAFKEFFSGGELDDSPSPADAAASSTSSIRVPREASGAAAVGPTEVQPSGMDYDRFMVVEYDVRGPREGFAPEDQAPPFQSPPPHDPHDLQDHGQVHQAHAVHRVAVRNAPARMPGPAHIGVDHVERRRQVHREQDGRPFFAHSDQDLLQRPGTLEEEDPEDQDLSPTVLMGVTVAVSAQLYLWVNVFTTLFKPQRRAATQQVATSAVPGASPQAAPTVGRQDSVAVPNQELPGLTVARRASAGNTARAAVSTSATEFSASSDEGGSRRSPARVAAAASGATFTGCSGTISNRSTSAE